MISCKSCGALIRFIEMRSGKKMPVDAGLVKTCFGEIVEGEPVMSLVTARGTIIRGREVSVVDPEGEPVEGYVSHFATCTEPKLHRSRA